MRINHHRAELLQHIGNTSDIEQRSCVFSHVHIGSLSCPHACVCMHTITVVQHPEPTEL